jgi:hypothetical protein
METKFLCVFIYLVTDESSQRFDIAPEVLPSEGMTIVLVIDFAL